MNVSLSQRQTLLATLQTRFEAHSKRHAGHHWAGVAARLHIATAAQWWALYQMESTGGEPDVIGYLPDTGKYLFCDCSVQTPPGRRNLCYDQQALVSRKANPPAANACDTALSMGIRLLTPDEYLFLQQLGPFDTTTSSWLHTPTEVRQLGGALFGDHRYGRAFVYHNGASSYYATRGFRGVVEI